MAQIKRRGKVDLADELIKENKILFAGTPEIAVPLLRALAKSYNVVGVLTSMDKSVGRSAKLCPSPVKEAAMELGLPVLQFDSLKKEARQAVRALGANVLVTFAYGKIFGPMFLALFPNGTFNVHPSPLPLFRGPSPIQATILHGLHEGAISLQSIGEKMDEGDLWAVERFPLTGKETTLTLTQTVAEIAANFVPDVLKPALCHEILAVPQGDRPSYCQMIQKEDGKLDFNKTAFELHCLVRASYPWPKAFAFANDKEVLITSVWGGFDELEEEPLIDVKPGTVVGFRKDRGIGVACADKTLWINGLQLPSKKELDHKAFINGNRWILDSHFS